MRGPGRVSLVLAAGLALMTALGGCGGSRHHTRALQAPAASACTVAPAQGGTPARMGACVQRTYGFTGPQRSLAGTQGLDVSNYQGYPYWASFARSGIRFVWDQTNDGPYFRDGNFHANYCAERRAGIVPGGYIFLRPGYVSAQIGVMVAAIWSAKASCPGPELPPLIDAEVPGSYANVAPAAAVLRARLGVNPCTYASPGLWDGSGDGGTCLDVASWGIQGRAFSWWAFKGGAGNYVAQQWCGTRCYVAGLEVDRQVDHGVLAKVLPGPAPESRATKARRLHDAQGRRRALRRSLLRYGCRRRTRQHEPLGPRCRRWYREGDQANATIRRLEREGIR